MLSILLTLVVVACVAGLVFWLINYIAPPDPIRKICVVVLVVVVVLWLIAVLTGQAGSLVNLRL